MKELIEESVKLILHVIRRYCIRTWRGAVGAIIWTLIQLLMTLVWPHWPPRELFRQLGVWIAGVLIFGFLCETVIPALIGEDFS